MHRPEPDRKRYQHFAAIERLLRGLDWRNQVFKPLPDFVQFLAEAVKMGASGANISPTGAKALMMPSITPRKMR